MGRGLISGGGVAGQYNLTYKVKRTDAEKKITALTARITALENFDIPKYEAGLTTAINDFNTKLAELNAAIVAKETADVLRQLAAEANKLRFAKDEAQNLLDSAKIRLISFIKEKDTLEKWLADFTDEELVVWCADLNEDLTDHVGTIEIPGERTEDIIIKPGGDAGDQAAYNPATDGQIAPSIGMTPSGTFYNLAILPGWQKWMPTYRLGVITAINYNNDTCDVTLRPALSKQKNLSGINFDVNQEILLTDVNIEYMDCHSKVFKINDHVVVQFNHSGPGELDYTPKVIGFKDHPRSCGLVFLIVSLTEYAVWRLGGGGASIKPSEFPLENYAARFSLPVHSGSSVVQSNEKLNEHKYILSTLDDDIYEPENVNRRYGVLTPNILNGLPDAFLNGLRNSYSPPQYDPDSELAHDGDLSYLSYSSDADFPVYPVYLCSGRHNWLIKDDIVYKEIELWALDATNGEFRYKTSAGSQVGDSLAIDMNKGNFYYAVLNKNEYVGINMQKVYPADLYGNSGPRSLPVFAHCCDRKDVMHSDNISYFMAYATRDEYMFGDVVIEVGLDFLQERWYGGWSYSTLPHCVEDEDCEPRSIYKRSWKQWLWAASEIIPLCYDHLDNDNETFVIIYWRYGGDVTYVNARQWVYGNCYPFGSTPYVGNYNFHDIQRLGRLKTFFISYRRLDGDIERVEICMDSYSSRTVKTYTDTWSGQCIYQPTVDTDVATVREGQQIFHASCKIGFGYIVYSYVLRDYIGPSNNNDLHTYVADQWEFNKRILGIIDIETGKRTEHEVDEDLLGDLYKDTFDEEKASAVGLHI